MSDLQIPPSIPTQERQGGDSSYKGFSASAPSRNGVDSKVQGFAQDKIVGNPGSLYASAAIPKAFFLPEKQNGEEEIFSRHKKTGTKKRGGPSSEKFHEEPIGLMPCDPDSWINAVMQLILHLPVFWTSLSLSAPRSFEPFREFIDQYNEDRKADLSISSAGGYQLVRCLKQILPSHLFAPTGHSHLPEICKSILFSCYPSGLFSHDMGRIHTGYFPIDWDIDSGSLLHLILKSRLIAESDCDLIVTVKGKDEKNACRFIPKQIFDPERGIYYDLHGFIETRPEGDDFESIAYLKFKGRTWYQCRNQRISNLCSTKLIHPLLSSHLLHYKRCCTNVYTS